jgi:hypothetical protein
MLYEFFFYPNCLMAAKADGWDTKVHTHFTVKIYCLEWIGYTVASPFAISARVFSAQ